MASPIIPENAPFSPAQRAWLNGFLQGVGAQNGASSGVPVAPSLNNGGTNGTAALPASQPEAGPAAASEMPRYDRDNPFPARVIDVRPLASPDSQKDVRFVALDLSGSGLSYEVGDALGLYPENSAELVEEVLEELGATGEEPAITPESRVVPVRMALLLAYVITRADEDLFALMADYAGDETEKNELLKLAEDGPEEDMDVLDALHRFPSARPPLNEFVSALTPLQPRLYSISSSLAAHPGEVHLTVGVVRWEVAARLRKGVASTYLAERVQPGQKIGVFVHPAPHFRLPENAHTPIIMVGPGTGVAPFRAFLEERRARGEHGNAWLFFGEQHRDHEFYYREELEKYLNDGTLTRLDTAFSRDQAEKIYVQQRMLEQAAEIWRWLEEGAHFYVCGDAMRMARDADNALKEIVATQGRLDAAEAKEYVANLSRTHRYQRDVY